MDPIAAADLLSAELALYTAELSLSCCSPTLTRREAHILNRHLDDLESLLWALRRLAITHTKGL
ncbi:hypothetical protein AXK59_23645 [Tsukamurella tyrosinosolvens]|nr:hypothetical protein AXK59_23645 [Tsukamurella tyrosinosolvens]